MPDRKSPALLERNSNRCDLVRDIDRREKNRSKFIAEAVDLLIFIDADWTLKAGRKVREVLAVTGFENGDYITHRL